MKITQTKIIFRISFVFPILLGATRLLPFVLAGKSTTVSVCPTRTIEAGKSGLYHYITSPGYPRNYSNNLSCDLKVNIPLNKKILIVRKFVELRSVDLPSSTKISFGTLCSGTKKDNVKIIVNKSNGYRRQRVYCAPTSSKKYASFGPFYNYSNVQVSFLTDGSITGRGFSLAYRLRDLNSANGTSALNMNTATEKQPITHSTDNDERSITKNFSTVYAISTTPSPSPCSSHHASSTFPVKITAKSSMASQKLIIIATSVGAGVMFIVMLAVLFVIYKRRTKAANLSTPVNIPQGQGYEMAAVTDPVHYEEVDAKPYQSQLSGYSKLDQNRQVENDNPYQKLLKAEKAPAAEDRSSTYEEVEIASNTHKGIGYTELGDRETINTGDYEALLKEEPQYEIPTTCQPEAYEEVITLQHSGYTELEKNRQRRKSAENVYEKLIQRDSGYVIPADGRRESYEDIQPTKNVPGYKELDKDKRESENSASYQKLLRK